MSEPQIGAYESAWYVVPAKYPSVSCRRLRWYSLSELQSSLLCTDISLSFSFWIVALYSISFHSFSSAYCDWGWFCSAASPSQMTQLHAVIMGVLVFCTFLYLFVFPLFLHFASLCPNHTLRTLECVRALSQQPWTCSNASFGGVAMLVRTGGGAKCFLPHTHRLPSLPSLSLLLSSSKSDMQSGFALLEAGSLGGTTVVNILFKNFADTLVRCCVLKTSPCLHCNKNIFLKKLSFIFSIIHFISSFYHLLLTHSFCRSVVILPLLSLHIAFLFFICRMYICMSHCYMTAYNVINLFTFNFLVYK